jgi:predicted ATPase
MRITRLRLENWRNFRDLDLPLKARAFFVGPNAAGKSNLLDAVLLLHDLAAARGGGLQAAVAAPRRGSVAALRCLFARAKPDILIDAEIGTDKGPRWRYALRLNAHAKTKRPVVVRETVWDMAADPERPLLDRPDDADRADPERLAETHLEQTSANRDFRAIADFFRSIRSFHPVPQLMRDPARFEDGSAEPYGTRLMAEIADTPARTREARLKRMNEALRVAVPQLDELQLELDRGVPHLRARYAHWHPRATWQREDQFSDGTLRLLGLVWTLMDRGGPLLLEEPELSLHAAVVAQLPSVIWRASRKAGRQSLITTHSHALLADESIGLDEVFVLRPGENGTELVRPAEIADIRAHVERGLSLPEAVMPLGRPEGVEQLPLFAGDWG